MELGNLVDKRWNYAILQRRDDVLQPWREIMEHFRLEERSVGSCSLGNQRGLTILEKGNGSLIELIRDLF